MKRVERKQLKEDEFVSGMGKFLDLLKKWRKEIFIAAGVLAFLVLVFFGLTALREVFPDAKFVSPAIDPGGHKEDLGGQSKTVEADVWGEYPVKTGSP